MSRRKIIQEAQELLSVDVPVLTSTNIETLESKLIELLNAIDYSALHNSPGRVRDILQIGEEGLWDKRDISFDGELVLEDVLVGKLSGFCFAPDLAVLQRLSLEQKSYVENALSSELRERAEKLQSATEDELSIDENGEVLWRDSPIAKLNAERGVEFPEVDVYFNPSWNFEQLHTVKDRLNWLVKDRFSNAFEQLYSLLDHDELSESAKVVAKILFYEKGVVPRSVVASEVKQLDQNDRGQLRRFGVRFGQFTVFMPLLLKPLATRLRVAWKTAEASLEEAPFFAPPGLVTFPVGVDIPTEFVTAAGFHDTGERAIRVDMLERLADLLRTQDSRGGFEATEDMLSITGLTLDQFAKLMMGLGYSAELSEGEANTEVSDGEGLDADAPRAAMSEGDKQTYVFKWQMRRNASSRPRTSPYSKAAHSRKPQAKPKGKRVQAKPSFADNPFAAALMGLKDDS